MSDDPILDLIGLTHRFAEGGGISDITLQIAAGDFVLLAGANGAGKTTLLRHLNGLLTPQSGSVAVAGKSVAADPRRARQLVGMVFQDADSQLVGETVADDVAFGPENLKLKPAEIQQRVDAALAAVGLSDRRRSRPHLLSGGEKRRLAIAGVLAMQPRVVVFDEPFSNLDYPGVRQILRSILHLHRSGHTIVLATHDLEKAAAHARRLIVMQRGCIVADGPVADVLPEVERFDVRAPCAWHWGRKVTSWLD